MPDVPEMSYFEDQGFTCVEAATPKTPDGEGAMCAKAGGDLSGTIVYSMVDAKIVTAHLSLELTGADIDDALARIPDDAGPLLAKLAGPDADKISDDLTAAAEKILAGQSGDYGSADGEVTTYLADAMPSEYDGDVRLSVYIDPKGEDVENPVVPKESTIDLEKARAGLEGAGLSCELSPSQLACLGSSPKINVEGSHPTDIDLTFPNDPGARESLLKAIGAAFDGPAATLADLAGDPAFSSPDDVVIKAGDLLLVANQFGAEMPT